MPYLVHMHQTHPTQHYVCHTEGCPYEGRIRKIYLHRAGEGMYQVPSMVCECSPDREMKRTQQPGPVADLDAQMQQWVLDEELIGSEPPC